MDASDLVGTWRLVHWRAVSEGDGGAAQTTYPMGEDARGFIHYGADGRMSVLIAAADRASFAVDDLLGGTDGERAAAFGSFVAYAGTFTVGEGAVTHQLDISLFPNWVGTQQERFATLEGDRLVLSTAPILTAGAWRRSELEWARIPNPA